MAHIRATTPKDSANCTDAFRGVSSKHHTGSLSNRLVDVRTKNLINGIEGFWSFAQHILHNYRGVSKYHVPMYLMEMEYCFNHSKDKLFKLLLRYCFGYVSL